MQTLPVERKVRRSPPVPSFISLRDVAIEAAYAGGNALLRRFRTRLKVTEKPGDGLVTNADFESERAAIRVLQENFPLFGILTEESDPRRAQSPGRFILDPLDGTANFAHGFPTFCVSIAVEWNREIVAGVIYHPVSGETYSAIRGKGAFVTSGQMRPRLTRGGPPGALGARIDARQRLKVSSARKLSDAFLSTGFCSRKEEWLSREIRVFERMSRIANAVRRPGSAALDLANVARGTFDGFWERGLKPWDVAAGALLLEEAGGRITGFSGQSMQLDSGEFLASNGILHDALVREIHEASNSQ